VSKGGDSQRIRLVFMHLPKVGGTTLHELLSANFPPDYICPERHNQLELLSQSQPEPYVFYSGHYTFDAIQSYIPDPKRLITMVRDPKARLVSIYFFGRSHRWEFVESHPQFSEKPHCYKLHGMCYRAAKELDLLSFLESEGVHLRDTMVNWMAGQDGLPRERLNLAKERLRRMWAFGLMEHMQESVELIFTRLGFPIPREIPERLKFENLKDLPHCEPIEREPITEAINRKLEELTTLDRQFYEYARKLFLFRRWVMRLSRLLSPRNHTSEASAHDTN
jgi:hypothetical protein